MILVFSGTKEGNLIIKDLAIAGMNIIASFSSIYGKESIDDYLKDLGGRIIVNGEKLDLAEILNLIENYKIKIIIDATHPFAINITKNAMVAAEVKKIKYIRFERKELPVVKEKNIHYFDSFKSSLNFLIGLSGNIFFTIGANNLKEYSTIIGNSSKERGIYIKILPTIESINEAIKAGAKTKQIVAFYGFWGKDILKSFIFEKSIKAVVTKQSGASGGENEKILASKETGCTLIVIKRPEIKCSNVCYSFDELIEEIKSYNST